MILIPLFCILILLLLQVLYFILKRLDVSLIKYKFWVMAGTAVTWIASVILFLLSPEVEFFLIWDIGFELLPGSILRLDDVSSALIMSITAVLFAASLYQENKPKQLAWLSGLGGICCLGTLANSPFTLLLIMTMIEIILILNFIFSEERYETTRRKLFAVIGRLVSPFFMLYAMLRGGVLFSDMTFAEVDASAGPLLMFAGLIGSIGWIGFLKRGEERTKDLIPRKYTNILPGTTGLLVMIRSADLMVNNTLNVLPVFAPGLIVLVVVLIGILIFTPNGSLALGFLAVISLTSILGEPKVTLAWCLVYLLSGALLERNDINGFQKSFFLFFSGLAMLPLPFLPAWLGVGVFTSTFNGFLFAVVLGLVQGRYIRGKLSKLGGQVQFPARSDLPDLIAGICLLLSLYLYTFRNGLITTSLQVATIPLAAWFPVLITAGVIAFSPKMPDIDLPFREKIPADLEISSRTSLDTGTTFIDQIIKALTNLFEGDGGLFWALLVGFLIITLISLGGN